MLLNEEIKEEDCTPQNPEDYVLLLQMCLNVVMYIYNIIYVSQLDGSGWERYQHFVLLVSQSSANALYCKLFLTQTQFSRAIVNDMRNSDPFHT